MYRGKSNNGYRIYGFNISTYKYNLTLENAGGLRCAFSLFPDFGNIFTNGYIETEDFDTVNYYNNFITELPKDTKLYFDKSSDYPRSKIELLKYKRCIKANNANAIVIGEQAKLINIESQYVILTDGIDVYAITYRNFSFMFGNDTHNLLSDTHLGVNFANFDLKILYFGYIKVVYDGTDTIKMFNNKTYNRPFILDKDLDRLVNETLPNPTLDQIIAISNMLESEDPSINKLGGLMASGFNINKGPLTFTILLGRNFSGYKCNRSVILKQLYKTLDYFSSYGSPQSISSLIQSKRLTYLDEDVKLAKDFVKTLPDFKRFCEKQPQFYLDSLPFVPDEGKV